MPTPAATAAATPISSAAASAGRMSEGRGSRCSCAHTYLGVHARRINLPPSFCQSPSLILFTSSNRHVHDLLVRIHEPVAYFGDRAKRHTGLLHLEHDLRQLDARHALLELRREVGSALSASGSPESRPCFITLANEFAGACDGAADTGGCLRRSFRRRSADALAPAIAWRGSGQALHRSACCVMIHISLGTSTPASRSLRQLVAQGARADAEPLRHRLAVAVVGAQRLENQVALGVRKGNRTGLQAAAVAAASQSRLPSPARSIRGSHQRCSPTAPGTSSSSNWMLLRLESPGRWRGSAHAA